MTTYAGKAPLTFVKLSGNRGVTVYAGHPVPADALPDELERLLEGGFIEKVEDDEVGGMVSDQPETAKRVRRTRAQIHADQEAAAAENGGGDVPSGPPAKSAVKDEWIAYAVSQGADQAEATAKNKDELIAEYGAS